MKLGLRNNIARGPIGLDTLGGKGLPLTPTTYSTPLTKGGLSITNDITMTDIYNETSDPAITKLAETVLNNILSGSNSIITAYNTEISPSEMVVYTEEALSMYADDIRNKPQVEKVFTTIADMNIVREDALSFLICLKFGVFTIDDYLNFIHDNELEINLDSIGDYYNHVFGEEVMQYKVNRVVEYLKTIKKLDEKIIILGDKSINNYPSDLLLEPNEILFTPILRHILDTGYSGFRSTSEAYREYLNIIKGVTKPICRNTLVKKLVEKLVTTNSIDTNFSSERNNYITPLVNFGNNTFSQLTDDEFSMLRIIINTKATSDLKEIGIENFDIVKNHYDKFTDFCLTVFAREIVSVIDTYNAGVKSGLQEDGGLLNTIKTIMNDILLGIRNLLFSNDTRYDEENNEIESEAAEMNNILRVSEADIKGINYYKKKIYEIGALKIDYDHLDETEYDFITPAFGNVINDERYKNLETLNDIIFASFVSNHLALALGHIEIVASEPASMKYNYKNVKDFVDNLVGYTTEGTRVAGLNEDIKEVKKYINSIIGLLKNDNNKVKFREPRGV